MHHNQMERASHLFNAGRYRELLGIPPDLSGKELERAIKLARANAHPDRGGEAQLATLVNCAADKLAPKQSASEGVLSDLLLRLGVLLVRAQSPTALACKADIEESLVKEQAELARVAIRGPRDAELCDQSVKQIGHIRALVGKLGPIEGKARQRSNHWLVRRALQRVTAPVVAGNRARRVRLGGMARAACPGEAARFVEAAAAKDHAGMEAIAKDACIQACAKAYWPRTSPEMRRTSPELVRELAVLRVSYNRARRAKDISGIQALRLEAWGLVARSSVTRDCCGSK